MREPRKVFLVFVCKPIDQLDQCWADPALLGLRIS